MQNTTNYNLNKPDGNDFVKIEFLNENADIIDGKLKELEDGLGNIDFSSIESQITAHTGNQQIHVTQADKTSWNGKVNRTGDTMTGDLVIEKGIPIIDLRNPNRTFSTRLRHNASNENDFGFDILRNNILSLTINASGKTSVLGNDGVLFSLADLKTSVSNGKAAIANAITQKGVATSASAEFAVMAANILNIPQRPKTASGTTTSTGNGVVQVNGLDFTPTYVRLSAQSSGNTLTYHFYFPLFGYPTTSGILTTYPIYGSGNSLTTDQTLAGMYNGGFHLPSGVNSITTVSWFASDGVLF